MVQPIYLDHCSTTPIDPSVLESMLPFLRESFGNPGTPHQVVGGVVQRAVREAREKSAELINCRPNELIWTSGATESNNLAILGFAAKVTPEKRHIITQVTEHSAVLEPCRQLEANGWRVTYLSVDKVGRISIDELRSSITDDTSMVSIMWGNNEIGTLQPIKEIAELCASRDIIFHCDAAQAAGKVPIDVDHIAVSMLTFSAHKFYGPKGVGALYVRDLNKRPLIAPRVFGGGQENGFRPGTLNVAGIAGMGVACAHASKNISHWEEHTSRLRDRLESKLEAELENIAINGDRNNRLPHIANIAFYGSDNEGLLTMLPEVVASTGSACHVADFEPSHVLTALGKGREVGECSIRFGFGKDNTAEQVSAVVELIRAAVSSVRSVT